MRTSKRLLCLIAAILCGTAVTAGARELAATSPQRAGFSEDRFQRVDAVVRDYVEQGRVSGIVTLVARDGRIVYRSSVGQMGFDDERPMPEDGLFRIYSMTKAVTAVAALILYEEGRFHLYDPVSDYLPAFADLKIYAGGELVPAERPMTMHHLFTHTSGLSYGFPPDHPAMALIDRPDMRSASDLPGFAEKLAALPLLFEPGTDWEYSFASDVLAAVVERISGQPLAEFFRERIFEPLDMRDTSFTVGADDLERLATLYEWDAEQERHVVQSAPPYGDPYKYYRAPFPSGGSGLVSTARDYMRLLEMLRRGGELDGNRVLGPKTVTFMSKDHLPRSITDANTGPKLDRILGRGGSHALGIGMYLDPVRRGVLSSPGEIEWGGAAGTIYWWDPIEDIVVVSMIQLRRSPWQLRLRNDLSVAIYQALTEVREAN